MRIPFNRPYASGRELGMIQEAIERGQLAGDGHFTRLCHRWLEARTQSAKALLTHSCTGALEMAAILAGLEPGDEVIMPAYTFVSTANAVVLRGAVPVFVDVRPDTMNLDERLVEAAVTEMTRALLPVHYAGVACEMDALLAVAERHRLWVIEDAAQGVMASYKGRPLGSIGQMGALSFHETKNVIAGEGGALLLNDDRVVDRGEIIREKGTNRSQFFRGQVDKYTWVDVGSSYLPGELIAAFLWAQMEVADTLTERRLALWNRYHAAFEELERDGLVRRPVVPGDCQHNAHMYYLMMPNLDARTRLIAAMHEAGIGLVFHYVPLHRSPAGQRYGRAHGALTVTEQAGDCLVRLPLWVDLEPHQDEVIDRVTRAVRHGAGRSAP